MHTQLYISYVYSYLKFCNRFVVTSIRNQLDYSPQAIYWIGGQIVDNEFKWLDGADITFKVTIYTTHLICIALHFIIIIIITITIVINMNIFAYIILLYIYIKNVFFCHPIQISRVGYLAKSQMH